MDVIETNTHLPIASSHAEVEPDSYRLFNRIKEVVFNNDLWINLLNYVEKLQNCNYYINEWEISTACNNTACLLSIMFLGEKRAIKINNAIQWISKDETDSIVCLNMLSGHYLLGYNREINGLKNTFKYADREIDKIANKIFLKKPFFNHCKIVLNRLEKDLKKSSKTVNEKVSYIYFISISHPTFKHSGPRYSKRDPVTIHYFHNFLLEQYYSPFRKETLVRLHQSWLNKFTVKKYYSVMDYDQDKGSMNEIQLNEFLHHLKNAFVYKEMTLNPSSSLSMKHCFGVEAIPPQVYYDKANKYAAGLSFGYLTTEIDPGKRLKKLEKFLKNFEKL